MTKPCNFPERVRLRQAAALARFPQHYDIHGGRSQATYEHELSVVMDAAAAGNRRGVMTKKSRA